MYEDHDYFPESSLSVCLQESQQLIPQDAVPTGEGDFTLTLECVHHCPSTDAIAGTYIYHASRHKTLEEAKDAMPEYDGDQIPRARILNTEGTDLLQLERDERNQRQYEQYKQSEAIASLDEAPF